MHRFFVPPESTQGSEISLPPAEARHAAGVLRFRPGDRAAILNGQGEEILGEAIDVNRRSVRLRVMQRQIIPRHPCRITLLQAVPKSRAMEVIIQKATELGAGRVIPILSERTIAQWDEAATAHKAAKWHSTAIEAAKQCGAPWLPQIDNPMSLKSGLECQPRSELTFLASLQPGAQHPRNLFEAFRSEHGRAPTSVAVWVGPEGDFTPAEINAVRGITAFPITLGPLVLRSETAALYCLSVVSYETQPLQATS